MPCVWASVSFFALPSSAVLISEVCIANRLETGFADKTPRRIRRMSYPVQRWLFLLALFTRFSPNAFDLHDQPRCDLHRKRRSRFPGCTKSNLRSCFVVRPRVRFRHIRKDLGVISLRISLITSPGERWNCSRIASKLVRSSHAIWMIRSFCARDNSIIILPASNNLKPTWAHQTQPLVAVYRRGNEWLNVTKESA